MYALIYLRKMLPPLLERLGHAERIMRAVVPGRAMRNPGTSESDVRTVPTRSERLALSGARQPIRYALQRCAFGRRCKSARAKRSRPTCISVVGANCGV